MVGDGEMATEVGEEARMDAVLACGPEPVRMRKRQRAVEVEWTPGAGLNEQEGAGPSTSCEELAFLRKTSSLFDELRVSFSTSSETFSISFSNPILFPESSTNLDLTQTKPK